MPKFVSVQSCKVDESGDIEMRLDDVSGKAYDLTFDLSFVPSMVALLNKTFFDSPKSTEPANVAAMVGAHVPTNFGLATLPDGSSALFVNTQSGMQIPLLATAEILTAIVDAASRLQAIALAEESARESGSKH